MAAPLPTFRTLYHLMEECHYRMMIEGKNMNVYQDVLLPWQPYALEIMSVLGGYGNLEAISWQLDESDPCSGGNTGYYTCLEQLYALSRINDVMLLPQQTVSEPARTYSSKWIATDWIPAIQLTERNEWLRSLGMQEIDHSVFHPFYHEIVEVEQSPDSDEPISLVAILWPGFMLGQMLFCRAGVRVRGGLQFVNKEIAEHSRLYWAFVRNNRRAVDDSHGWGHNSQWGTDFRRDYVTEDAFYYNVDGEIDIHEKGYYFDEYGNIDLEEEPTHPYLGIPARIELLTNRCFIVTPERFYNEELGDVTYREMR